jgi:hypothetical protein
LVVATSEENPANNSKSPMNERSSVLLAGLGKFEIA